jgi:hypothetical protein
MNKAIHVVPVVLSLAAQLAFAADTAPQQAKKDPLAAFKAADTNGDGGLSRDELAKTPETAFRGIKDHFDEMDTNKDGKVTSAEGNVWGMKQRYKHGM